MPNRARLAAFAILSCLLAAPPARAGEAWATDVETARKAAAESGRHLLVDLYADWCGWCKKLEREVFSHPEFEAWVAPRFVKLRVDVEDGGPGTALQARYRAGSLPTTLLLTSELVLIGHVVGFAPRAAFVENMERSLDRFAQERSGWERVLTGEDMLAINYLAAELTERGSFKLAERAHRRRLEQTGLAPGDRARVFYDLADVLRRARRFDEARAELAAGRAVAAAAGEGSLVEAIDLFEIEIARARGGCAAQVAALEAFLASHPESLHERQLRSSLDGLKRNSATCT